MIFEHVASPLIDNIYGPIAERNRLAGIVAVNATLTAPRLLEPKLGQRYIDHLRAGHQRRATFYGVLKAALKVSDGLDGSVARGTDTTSLFGAGFDPLVDMLGTRDDGRRIKEAHDHMGISDPVTNALIDTRGVLDITVIGIGGVANTLAATAAEKRGAEVPERDKPKANAFAKLKFGLSSLASGLLTLGTVTKKPERARKLKKSGTILLGGSVVAGLISTVQYAGSVKRNIMRAFRPTEVNLDGVKLHPLEQTVDLPEGHWKVLEKPKSVVHTISTNSTRRGVEGSYR